MAEYIISRVSIVYINDTAVNIRVCVCVLEQNPWSKLLHKDETTQIKLKTSNSGYLLMNSAWSFLSTWVTFMFVPFVNA